MLLKPAIVTAHLLGGMTILALLAWLVLAQSSHAPSAGVPRACASGAALALATLAVQIALGGWVSANYAALALPRSAAVPRAGGAADGFCQCLPRRARARADRAGRAAVARRRSPRSTGPIGMFALVVLCAGALRRARKAPARSQALGDARRRCSCCSSRSAWPTSRSACRCRSPPPTMPARRLLLVVARRAKLFRLPRLTSSCDHTRSSRSASRSDCALSMRSPSRAWCRSSCSPR